MSENKRAKDILKKDDLIVIGGAGGFIAGVLARRFHEQGFTLPFSEGLARTYAWIEKQYNDRKAGIRTVI